MNKLADEVFGITQKLLAITSSKPWPNNVSLRNFSDLVLQPEEQLVTSSRLLLLFIILFTKTDWVSKEKLGCQSFYQTQNPGLFPDSSLTFHKSP